MGAKVGRESNREETCWIL